MNAPSKTVVTISATAGVIALVASICWLVGRKAGLHPPSGHYADKTGVAGISNPSGETRRTRGLAAGLPPAPSSLREFEAALKLLETSKDPMAREESLEALVSGVAPGEIPSMLEFLGSWDSKTSRSLRVRLI